MRYDVFIGGTAAARFDHAFDAQEYLCLAHDKKPGVEFDLRSSAMAR